VLLEETPSNIEVLSLSPLYSMSLAIKYFFDSILQIFSFIAVLLYVNVMRIILKQVYDEK
jgi:antibiotic biosynthesis monooxygenase (ABM) superfamily enzyme